MGNKKQQAEKHFANGNYSSAWTLLEELHAKCPSDPKVLIDMGRMLYSLDKIEKSVNCFLSAFQLDPKREDTRQHLKTLLDDNEVSDALKKEIKQVIPPHASSKSVATSHDRGSEQTGNNPPAENAHQTAHKSPNNPSPDDPETASTNVRQKGNSNVMAVADKHLCNSCGVCAAVCPNDAISFSEDAMGYLEPQVDETLCNRCGHCISVCQGSNLVDDSHFDNIEDPFHGCIKRTFVGQAADQQILENSQSGGIGTALAVSALEDDDIGGVMVVSMPPGNPPRPEVKIAHSKEDLVEAQKSKYSPTPLLAELDDILDIPGKMAIVGLPCHIQAVCNVIDHFPEYKDKIGYKIGLVCDRVLTYAAMEYLIEESGVHRDQRVGLTWRDKQKTGYPGDVSVDGEDSVILPAKLRMAIKDMFTPIRCRMCFDKMNIFSDVTLGDPHGIDDCDREMGESIVLARTEQGQDLIETACKKQYVNLRSLPTQDVLEGQKIDAIKKKLWARYTKAWSQLGYELPAFPECISASAGSPEAKLDQYKDELQKALNLKETTNRKKILSAASQRFSKIATKFNEKTFEIRGVGFINKGAELMLHSVLQHYEDWNVKFAMEPNAGKYTERAKLGIFQKLTINGQHINIEDKNFRKLYGLVSDDEIDVVLDASGFMYTDHFGPKPCELMAHNVKRWKKQGTKVILLPQAFGPFTNEQLRTAAQYLIENADLVFPRDKVSLKHLQSLNIPLEHTFIAPDFTNLTQGFVPETHSSQKSMLCIIPNIRIYQTQPKEISNNYMPLLTRIAQTALDRGIEPFILIHEGKMDLQVGQGLQKSVNEKMEIIQEEDPLKVKGLIGQCHAVVSSRYHGLIGALSQAIPSLGTGWSHKYRMLFEDYGCPECMLDLRKNPKTQQSTINMLFDSEKHAMLKNLLSAKSKTQKTLSSEMWAKVDEVVSGDND